MGKTSGESLADRYGDFLDPYVKVISSMGEIPTGAGVYIKTAEVISSVGMEPDMAIVVYLVDKYSGSELSETEKYFDVGQKIEIKAGYGDDVSRIFLGYLHQMEAEDSMQRYVEYTLICLDVKGLMKKNNIFQVSGAKKTQQILNDILNAECYGNYVEKKEIDPLPGVLNQDCVISGTSHYDWLCGLAAGLDYEFFCGMGRMVFRKARKAGNDVLELSAEYGLQKVKRIVTMADQTGSIQVCGYNRKDEKILGTAKWAGMPGPFTKKLKQALAGYTLTFLDRELGTGDEAEKRARALMARRAGKCVCMEAAAIGLPQLLPGICLEIVNEQVPSLSDKIYVEEVRHLMDQESYTTTVTGVKTG